jgi:hypothetical protein
MQQATLLPPTETDLRTYANGWFCERKSAEIPAYLKAIFALIGLFVTGYLVVSMSGFTQPSQSIQATDVLARSGEWAMYAIAAVTLVYACIAAVSALRKSDPPYPDDPGIVSPNGK